MEYCVDANGYIGFSRHLNDSEVDMVTDILSRAFIDRVEWWPARRLFYISTICSQYHENETCKILADLATNFPVESGEIEYRGNDCTFWRFVFKDGNWIEQEGDIVYREENSWILGNVE